MELLINNVQLHPLVTKTATMITIFLSVIVRIYLLFIFIPYLISFYSHEELANPQTDSFAGNTSYSSFYYPSEWNYHQSLNNCGSYAVAGALRALDEYDSVDSETLVGTIKFRIPDRLTFPSGLEHALQDHGKITQTPYLHSLKKDSKLLYIQNQLKNGNAVIILGGYDSNYYKHYITLLGYESDFKGNQVFYVYDSLVPNQIGNESITQDLNGKDPGNKTMTDDELYAFWSNGGFLGMYQWYSIIVTNPS